MQEEQNVKEYLKNRTDGDLLVDLRDSYTSVSYTHLDVYKRQYLHYLIPGLVSLTTMNGSFSAIAQNLNVQRLYEKAFDQVMISPTPLWQFVLGQVIAGSLRGLYAGFIILLMVWPLHTLSLIHI